MVEFRTLLNHTLVVRVEFKERERKRERERETGERLEQREGFSESA